MTSTAWLFCVTELHNNAFYNGDRLRQRLTEQNSAKSTTGLNPSPLDMECVADMLD